MCPRLTTPHYKVVETNTEIEGYYFDETNSVTSIETTVSKAKDGAADLKDIYETITVKVRKMDMTTVTPVEGAKLCITYKGEDGSEVKVDEWTSTKEDRVIEGLLPGVEYTLTELEAPADYDPLEEPIVFTVAADGKVTIVSAPETIGRDDTEVGEDGVSIINVWNSHIEGDVTTTTTEQTTTTTEETTTTTTADLHGDDTTTTTTKSSGTTTTSRQVRTGDDSPLGMYTLMLLAAAAAIVGVFWRRKKAQ